MRHASQIRTLGAAVAVLTVLAATSAHGQTPPSQTATGGAFPVVIPTELPIPAPARARDPEAIGAQRDEAVDRALELETRIATLDEDLRALDRRLSVLAERVRAQRLEVARSTAALAEAEIRFRERLVILYKRGTIEPLSLLFTADTIGDLVTRATALSRISEDDARVVTELNQAIAEARYQESVLSDLLEQDTALHEAESARLVSLKDLKAEQDALIERLSEEAREALYRARALSAEERRQWREASILLGTPIERAAATVSPYPGITYAVASYMPRRYVSTGESWTALCSWYGPGFHGRMAASGQIFNEDDFTCASRTLPFGTLLALSNGYRRVLVYVNDRGPYVGNRELDLSKAAARALGIGGVGYVRAEIVTMPEE